MTCRVVVLVSGSGTLLAALLAAIEEGSVPASVVAVGADRDGIEGLARAQRAGIPIFCHPYVRGSDRAAWDAELTELVAAHAPDLVVSAGFMKLVGESFLARFGGRMINTHPALLPSFPGMHGPRDALAAGVKVTGATVIQVDSGVDTGRILAQEAVPVLPDDTVESLHERIKVVERRLLIETVTQFASAYQSGTIQQPEERRTRMSDRLPVTRALLSTYDKTGLEDLGRALADAGAEIVSTGSTAQRLADAGVPVTPVDRITGFPECLDGRVKTLHPMVHAGILADRRLDSHREQLTQLGVEPFDLVVVNLYPFSDTVASGATPDECIEQIDIGGPTMVRAAAKNHPNVAIVTSPDQYAQVTRAVAEGGFTLAERQRLAAAAFVHTAEYDIAVASWMGSVLTDSSGGDGFPAWIGGAWHKAGTLRYGENAHQPAALYAYPAASSGITQAEQLHGKEMSYNNYTDGDAAYRAAYDFDEPCVAIIKHANPCGIAIGSDIADAHAKAHACDPLSAFGGVIATNRPVSVAMAENVKDIFTEVVIAPGYEPGALEILGTKKNIRLLTAAAYAHRARTLHPISGGALLQAPDRLDAEGDDPANWNLAAGKAADAATLADLEFAWRACRAVKSNAILLAADGASVGVGMGQVNRVDSCRLAVERAGERAAGSVAASDAFFPFADGPRILIEAGVKAIVQPGGSVRDDETIEECRMAGVTLYLTGTRHFFH